MKIGKKLHHSSPSERTPHLLGRDGALQLFLPRCWAVFIPSPSQEGRIKCVSVLTALACPPAFLLRHYSGVRVNPSEAVPLGHQTCSLGLDEGPLAGTCAPQVRCICGEMVSVCAVRGRNLLSWQWRACSSGFGLRLRSRPGGGAGAATGIPLAFWSLV